MNNPELLSGEVWILKSLGYDVKCVGQAGREVLKHWEVSSPLTGVRDVFGNLVENQDIRSVCGCVGREVRTLVDDWAGLCYPALHSFRVPQLSGQTTEASRAMQNN